MATINVPLKTNALTGKLDAGVSSSIQLFRPLTFTPMFIADANTLAIGATEPKLNFTSTVSQVAQRAAGSRSYEFNAVGGSENSLGFGGVTVPSWSIGKGNTIHAQFSVYFPLDFDWTANPHLKFWRLRTETAGGVNEGYNDIYIENETFNGVGNDGRIKHIHEIVQTWTYTAQHIQKGKWETFEVQTVLDDVPMSSGGTARTQMWRRIGTEMVRILDVQNQKTLTSATSVCRWIYYFSYWNGNAPKTQKCYADRLVVHNNINDFTETDALGNKIIGCLLNTNNVAAG